MELITSKNNEIIKQIRSLDLKKYRDKHGIFWVEGKKFVSDAIVLIKSKIVNVFIDESKKAEFADIINLMADKVVFVNSAIYESITSTITPQGIGAIIKLPTQKEFKPTKPFLVLDHVQDPGNLGTIVRTAIATGFDDIVLLETCDPFCDKVARSSASGIYSVNFYKMETHDFINYCKTSDVKVFIAEASGENIFEDHTKPPNIYGLIIGSEGQGVSKDIFSIPHKSIALPMSNKIESLNAAISASVIMYIFANKKFN